MKPYVFGVDVGGTSAKIGLFKTDGTMVEKTEVPTGLSKTGAASLRDIADVVRARLAADHLLPSDLAGVGLDVPGPILEDGTVSDFANLSWGKINVRETLSSMLDHVPVAVGNDADVAALGEMWKGAGQGYENIVMVTLGTGVGGGIVLHGKILAGHTGAAGEIGHMLVNRDETDVCGCGKKGCLEQYASATGLVRVTGKLLDSSDTPSVLRDTRITAKSIFDAAREGDALALEAIHIMCRYLGETLANVAAVADPEIIIIGGGVSAAGAILIDTIRSYYEPAAFFSMRDMRFAPALLGNDGGMYGAARLVLS